MLSRYRDELEADFAEQYPSNDLTELWRSRQWRKLLNLIDQLRQPSRYHEAIANDDEHVAMILEAKERSKTEDEAGPRLRDFTSELDALLRAVDAINSNTMAVIAAGGGTPKRVEPQARPTTAFERVAYRRRSAKHQSLVARALRKQEDR